MCLKPPYHRIKCGTLNQRREIKDFLFGQIMYIFFDKVNCKNLMYITKSFRATNVSECTNQSIYLNSQLSAYFGPLKPISDPILLLNFNTTSLSSSCLISVRSAEIGDQVMDVSFRYINKA